MTIFEPGQVVLIPFPFTDFTAIKQRPALVISSASFNQTHRDLIAVAITSQNPFDTQSDEITLTEESQKSAGLPKPSKVKAGKIISIDQNLIRKKLGSISAESLNEIAKRVHSILYTPSVQIRSETKGLS